MALMGARLIMPSETRAGRYAGPPGDPEAYYLPRDMKAWEASWDRYLGESAPLPTLDTSRRRGQAQELDMSPEAVAERAERKRREQEAIAYVASYTGSWGLPLDIRARKAWGTKHLKLTEGQVDALLKGRDRDLERAAQDDAARAHPDHQRAVAFVAAKVLAGSSSNFFQSLHMQATHRPLSTNQIAAVIRIANEEAEREAQRQPAPAPQGSGMASQRAPGAPLVSGATTGPDDGWYVVDGEPWKVQWNRERTRKYAKRLVRRDPTAVRESMPDVGAGSWEYVPGGLGIVARKGSRMTIEDAERYGKLYGVCAVCGRTLTFEGSIERGIGPICYGRITG